VSYGGAGALTIRYLASLPNQHNAASYNAVSHIGHR
jgi:hypothetical protein